MKSIIVLLYVSVIYLFLGTSCEEFIEISPPRTDLVNEVVFSSDETALASMTDIYYQVGDVGFGSGGIQSVTLLAALSSDELLNGITYDDNYAQLESNRIIPSNSLITFLWQDLYNCIYKCNSILEGLTLSDQISESVRNQLIGEAKFFRAFCHFYLINLYGDVPLITTTDYQLNQQVDRANSQLVYDQIISDLTDAESLLYSDYSFSSGEKIRVNSFTATAFLARVYLYVNDWDSANLKATEILNNQNYSLETDLRRTFLRNSSETIFQFYPPAEGYTNDVITFLGYGFSLTSELVDSFEPDDKRKSQWIENGVYGAFNYPVKYYSIDGSFSEYSMVLRLAEQYLIRAEARLMRNDVNGGISDLNVLRSRAGLPDLIAQDSALALSALEK